SNRCDKQCIPLPKSSTLPYCRPHGSGPEAFSGTCVGAGAGNRVIPASRASGIIHAGMEPTPRTWKTWTAPGELDLKLGGRLSDVTLAYETWGTPGARGDNTLVVLHALSGSSH